jgi:hypothetical protein
VKYFVGYVKGESREIENEKESIDKNCGRPLSYIFLFEAAPNSGKYRWSRPLFLTHASPPPPHPIINDGFLIHNR